MLRYERCKWGDKLNVDFTREMKEKDDMLSEMYRAKKELSLHLD